MRWRDRPVGVVEDLAQYAVTKVIVEIGARAQVAGGVLHGRLGTTGPIDPVVHDIGGMHRTLRGNEWFRAGRKGASLTQ
ncbi:hypothetical protein GCM10017559_42670 [Streptosporangium longisporum]|uniref:Uncharacterized protein n=1 Tax=Streptosporangium longisporum TaxID=46187 RepID=A0ABN3Y259_9ACTN